MSRSEFFKISGKRMQLSDLPAADWKFEARPGGYFVAIHPDGTRKRILATDVKGKFSFSSGAAKAFGEISKPSHSSGAAGFSEADFTAQFPGKVRKVLVSDQESVSEGQALILLEAMKMEFSIKAPCAGKVAKVRVTEGQQLAPGTLLLDFKAQESK
ncbi:MAG: hypothetical protein JNL01_06565 [Bdellovibrionales bacterium]|nr:hypothetical protein [Bdellovibrionales bacterium]